MTVALRKNVILSSPRQLDMQFILLVICMQDTESDYNTPRSTVTLPDVPELTEMSQRALSCRTTPGSLGEAAAAAGNGGALSARKRVFIPDSPVTPITEQRWGAGCLSGSPGGWGYCVIACPNPKSMNIDRVSGLPFPICVPY